MASFDFTTFVLTCCEIKKSTDAIAKFLSCHWARVARRVSWEGISYVYRNVFILFGFEKLPQCFRTQYLILWYFEDVKTVFGFGFSALCEQQQQQQWQQRLFRRSESARAPRVPGAPPLPEPAARSIPGCFMAINRRFDTRGYHLGNPGINPGCPPVEMPVGGLS